MKLGDRNIMTTLKESRTWITYKSFSTHHEVGIGFIKYIRTSFTLQLEAKYSLINVLLKVELLPIQTRYTQS